ncbi:MAG TPA: hypothetical protein VMJ31_02515 [Methylocystis sp.]|nr:hypothetical protein [Methylocystis sp.]
MTDSAARVEGEATGIVPRALSALRAPSDRLVLALFFLSLFCLDYLPNLFGALPFPTIELIAFFAVACALRRFGADAVLSGADYALLGLAGLALAHPWRHMGGLVLTLVGLWFCMRRDARLAAIGQLSLGLACVDVWGPVLQAGIEEFLLPLETSFAFLILSRLGDFALIGNAISGAGGHTIVVEASCSAFLNVVATSLLWLSFLKIQERAAGRRQWLVLLVGVTWVVLVNTVRLILCAWSMESYLFWHEGAGVIILEWLLLGGLLALFYFGLDDEERPLIR